MKKRIASNNSIGKSDKSIPVAVQLTTQKDKAQKHKHHNHCPLPKPHKKDHSKHKQVAEQLISIKQLKTPILNELRHLICHLINSSDRMAQLIKDQQHQCFSQIYLQDRRKLIEYMNSLNVRQVHINQAQTQPSLKFEQIQENYYNSQTSLENLNKTVEESLFNEVKEIKQKINKAIDRKRSKSGFTDLQKYLQKEVSVVKDKIQSLQKKNIPSHSQQFGSFLKIYNKLNGINQKQTYLNNPQSTSLLGGENETLRNKIAEQQRKNEQLSFELAKLKGEVERIKSILVYLELLLFKCEQILQEHQASSQSCSTIQKEKMNLVISTLQSSYQYLQQQQNDASISSVTLKLKQQAHSMIIHLGQLRKKSLLLLQQKQKALQSLREQKQNYERQEQYCGQLKLKVNRLNNDMSDLIQEMDKKDELSQYLRIENNNLKEDLRNMQEFVKQTKQNYNGLAFQLQESNQKIKSLEALLYHKQEQICELYNQLQLKNKQLIVKLQELQSKEEDINLLKQQHHKAQQSRTKSINNLIQEKKLLTLQKQQKQNKLKQTQGKLKFLEEQSFILEKKIQSVFNGQQEYKYKVQALQQKIHALQLQNQQLYKDIKQYQTNQQSNQETTIQISQLYKQLQQECSHLRQQVSGDKMKIKFYEEKVVELAELADPTYYEKIISNYEQAIAKLTSQLQHYQNQHIIIQESVQEHIHSDSPSQKEDKEELPPTIFQDVTQVPFEIEVHQPKIQEAQQDKDTLNYVPFLMQDENHENVEHLEHLSHQNHEDLIDHLKPADVSHSPSYISALSHYDIVVTNQNQDTIDVHKAVYPKTPKKPQSPQQQCHLSLEEIQQKDISNFADISQSNGSIIHKDLHEDYININKIQYQDEKDKKSDKLSDLSKNVNLDHQANHKINDFDQDDFLEHQSTSNKKQINDLADLIMPQLKPNQLNEIRSSNILFKNVNQHQELQAQMRLSGQRDNHSLLNTSKNSPKKVNEQKKPVKNGSNIYIRIRKQSVPMHNLNQKPYRSSSCYNQQT